MTFYIGTGMYVEGSDRTESGPQWRTTYGAPKRRATWIHHFIVLLCEDLILLVFGLVTPFVV
jgi:hypothetical protein